MRLSCVVLAFVVAAIHSLGGTGLAEESSPDRLAHFDNQVLPLLESKCFKCHGSGEKLKGGLRLTSREGLLHGGELGPSYDETEPSKSNLLQMISYKDDEHRMPPKAKLSDEEIAILTKWISEGAFYNPEKEIRGPLAEKSQPITEADFDYWAYKPIERPVVPDKAIHPIDAFVNARLRAEGLEPNRRASRQTLIRRAFYDLTGLPPTIAEVRNFVKDPRPDDEVWRALLADLLDRPQYGEKWARHWLDLVRYAETNGFEIDGVKPQIWRYRDYVINAFNADKPYDQFIIEQLAGDEIAEPTLDSIAATGFHRIMQWDFDPVDRKQQTYDVLADNVAITSETFLGTTLGCARCHDHKADPFTQRDYYSFMAFFHGVTNYALPGTLVYFAEPKELAEFETKKQADLDKARQELVQVETQLKTYLSEQGKLEGACSEPVTYLSDSRGTSPTWEITFDRPTEDWKSVGFADKRWEKRRGGFGANATTKWSTSDIWMRAKFGVKQLPESVALQIYHSGNVEVYLNGFEIFRAKGSSPKYERIVLESQAVEAFQTGNNVVALHCQHSDGTHLVDLGLQSAPENSRLAAAIRKGGNQLAKETSAALGVDLVAERRSLLELISKTRKQVFGTAVNAVMEHEKISPLHVHIRGSAHAPGEQVEPAFPAVLHRRFDPVRAEVSPPSNNRSKSTSGRRLALARWIASAVNPLTARVAANRLWQHHFGQGIVPSTSDFGKLGEKPTHPMLLDWLASELPAQEWSLKAMHQLIMTSDAYQRSSTPNRTALEMDPTNRFFWRFNMRRLTAEEIRDSILAVSGKLNLQMGGKWVCPPLPEEVLATSSKPGKNWPVAQGDQAFRRSIYVHVKRSLRVPILVDHDQADTDGHCAVRFSTTVPTQALGMLNSRFVNERAADLAARLRREIPDTDSLNTTLRARITLGLELVAQDHSTRRDQIDQLMDMAEKLRALGLDEDTILERIALLTLNLNEFVYID